MLLSSGVTHYTADHLFSNMVAISSTGPPLLTMLGCQGCYAFFVLSAVTAALTSAVWWGVVRQTHVQSVGASGVATAMMAANGLLFPDQQFLFFGMLIAPLQMLGLHLVLDLCRAHIDVAAHMGGAAFGCLYTMLLLDHNAPASNNRPWQPSSFMSSSSSVVPVSSYLSAAAADLRDQFNAAVQLLNEEHVGPVVLAACAVVASAWLWRRCSRTRGGMCLVCGTSPRTMVFLDCRHMVCCGRCSKIARNCPTCTCR